MGSPHLWVRESGLNWDPADVTVPPLPAIAPGSDPMSAMVSAIMPGLSAIVAEGVAEARAREERFASNVTGARNAYQNVDGAEQQRIQTAAEHPAVGGAAAATPPESAAGQSSQFGQLMGTAMQMASQAAQIPMQVAGMAAAIPQGIMQGAQSAMQQVGQLSGQFDKSSENADNDKEQNQLDPTPEERDREKAADENTEESGVEAGEDGAASGARPSERAPGADAGGEQSPAVPVPPGRTPAQTRPADGSDPINL
jgi:hypothetical protein